MNKKKILTKQDLTGMLFALPTILGFIWFAAGPMLYSLFISLTDKTIIAPGRFVGLDNYILFLSGRDQYFWKSLGVTCYYVLLSVPLSMALAFTIALFLNKITVGKSIFRTIFYLPSIVPIVAICSIWTWIFNVDLGFANSILKQLGFQPLMWLSSEKLVVPTLAFINLWNIGPLMVIFLAGLQDVPKELLEAVYIDGGRYRHKLFNVIIPLMTPTIFYNLIISVINNFQIFTQAYIMTNGGPGTSSLFYVYYLYREAFQYMRMGRASALAWLLFIPIALLSLLLFKSSKSWVFYYGEE
jgi:multiple sugar transport system permease protein